MSLHMTAKDVDIFGMYLVVNGYETKYVKEFYKLWQSKYVN
jgi:hypothetical protein